VIQLSRQEVACADSSREIHDICQRGNAVACGPRRGQKNEVARLPKSTLDAIDWLLKYVNDSERLRKFLEGRPADELALIKNYVAWKKSQ
jgi:hypothetical protein